MHVWHPLVLKCGVDELSADVDFKRARLGHSRTQHGSGKEDEHQCCHFVLPESLRQHGVTTQEHRRNQDILQIGDDRGTKLVNRRSWVVGWSDPQGFRRTLIQDVSDLIVDSIRASALTEHYRAGVFLGLGWMHHVLFRKALIPSWETASVEDVAFLDRSTNNSHREGGAKQGQRITRRVARRG